MTQTRFSLEVRDGYTVLITSTGDDRYARKIHPWCFMTLVLVNEGVSHQDIATLLAKCRHKSPERMLSEVMEFCADMGFVTDNLKEQRVRFGVEQIERMFADIRPDLWKYRFTYNDEAPRRMVWNVSTDCLARCVYCYLGTSTLNNECSRTTWVSKDLILKSVRDAHAVGCFDLMFAGGDPFARPDMIDIIEEIVSTLDWPRVSATTKCALACGDLRRLKGMQRIHWSLDTLDPALGAYLTGLDDFVPHLLESISNAIELGISVQVCSTASKYNHEDIPRLVETLAKRGVTRFRITKCEPAGPGGEANIELDELKWQTMLRTMADLKMQLPPTVVVDVPLPLELAHKEDDLLAYGTVPREDGRWLLRCATCVESIRLEADGTCLYCQDLPQLVLGSLKEQSIMEIWRSDAMSAMRQAYSHDKYEGSGCFTCYRFNDCDYRVTCLKRSFRVHGSVFAPPDEHCRMNISLQNAHSRNTGRSQWNS